MSDWCDFDPPEFYAETFPTARKVHRCCECKAPIPVGEKHLYARGKNDGDFWKERQHMLCRELCMLMNDDDGCCGFGQMKETWGEGYARAGRETLASIREARTLYARILRRERAARRPAPREAGTEKGNEE